MLPPRAGIIATLARGYSLYRMQLKILKHVTLYKDNRFHSAFPSIIKLDNGQLLLAFRRARDCNWLLANDNQFESLSFMDHLDPRSHICLLNFTTSLEQIGEPRIYPIDPEAGDQDPSLLNLDDGKILLCGFSWYPFPGYIQKRLGKENFQRVTEITGCGYRYWGSYTGFSADNGVDWYRDHNYLFDDEKHQAEHGKRKTAGAIRGKSIHTAGRILLATYEGDGSTLLWESTDLGKNWQKISVIAKDDTKKILFQEPSLYLSPAGKLFSFMRTQGADFRLATAVSHDLGEYVGRLLFARYKRSALSCATG